MATLLNNLGEVARLQGAYTEAKRNYEQALITFEEIEDRHGLGMSLINLGHVAYVQEAYGQAVHFYERSMTLYEAIGEQHKFYHCGHFASHGTLLSKRLAVKVMNRIFGKRTAIRLGRVWGRKRPFLGTAPKMRLYSGGIGG